MFWAPSSYSRAAILWFRQKFCPRPPAPMWPTEGLQRPFGPNTVCTYGRWAGCPRSPGPLPPLKGSKGQLGQIHVSHGSSLVGCANKRQKGVDFAPQLTQHCFWLEMGRIPLCKLLVLRRDIQLQFRDSRLRLEVRDWNDTFHWAAYKRFRVSSENKRYALHVSGHSGTLRNALYTDNKGSKFNHNGMAFSTYDMDNDKSSANCAMLYAGETLKKKVGRSGTKRKRTTTEQKAVEQICFWKPRSIQPVSRPQETGSRCELLTSITCAQQCPR